jgi:O-antigen ligase
VTGTHVLARGIGLRSSDRATARALAGPASVVIAAAWWLGEVTRAWAGRDAPSVTVGAGLIAIAVLLVRPQDVLPARVLWLATAISTAAFIVALTAPTGWRGAPVAAVYVSSTWLAVVVAAALVRQPALSAWLIVVVVGSAAAEFMGGWLAWWGGRDPSAPMVGTFFWHNPFAAFLMPGALIGLACWIWQDRLFALLGLVSFCLGTVGIVYSTSRATLACFGAGALVIAVMGGLGPRPLRAGRQLVVAAVIAAACTYFVAGPPFFSHRTSPFDAIQARTTGQSLGQNGGYRLDFWHEALTVFRAHPLTGGGYKSLVAESLGRVPRSWPLSPYAHNAYLQALSDGGLVLAVPFLLAVVAVVVLTVRSVVRCARRRDPSILGFAVPVALGAVLLHSGVDFDWTYAADFAMAAVLSGVVLGWHLHEGRRDVPAPAPTRARMTRRASTAAALVGVALLGLSAWVIREGDHRANLQVTAGHETSVAVKDRPA